MGRRLPDPGTVEVQRHVPLPAGPREGDQLVPRGQEVAGVAQRQLEQGRPERARDGGEVLDQRHGRAVGEQGEVETVQQARPVALVAQQVRQRRDGHPAGPARVAPDAQHRLLGHHPAREERGGRLPEHLGEPALERRDRAVLPVAVPLVRVGRATPPRRRGRAAPPRGWPGVAPPASGSAAGSAARARSAWVGGCWGSSAMGSSSTAGAAGAPGGRRGGPV